MKMKSEGRNPKAERRPKSETRIHLAALAFLLLATGCATQPGLKFAFGAETKSGWTSVAPTNIYSADARFGFEPGAQIRAADTFAGSDQPFYFSARLPEGNYRVTAVLGGDQDSRTTVKAELRRLMLEKIHTAPGQTAERSFIVNLRTPRISDTNHVHLKSREQTSEIWDWDDKLTLEFNGTHPALQSLAITKADVPTVFLMGDSTVCDQPAEPWNSWGQMLPRFFRPDVAVANHAESGETVADSLRAQRFEKIFSLMKPGDYLLVQFGHNDMKNKAANALDVYRVNLKNIVARTRQLGGTPVLVTSMERKNGVSEQTLAGYPQAVREVAQEEKCALIDLNAMSRVLYKALGKDLDKAFQDGTHHNNYGSYELAQCVVAGIKQARLPLAKSIAPGGGDFDPAHPDPVATFDMPASPNASAVKPLGN
jgi:lysophospholipase L1-like esterase